MAVKMSVLMEVVVKVVMVVVVVVGGVVRTQGENIQDPHSGQDNMIDMIMTRNHRDIIANVLSCPSRQDYVLWLPWHLNMGGRYADLIVPPHLHVAG